MEQHEQRNYLDQIVLLDLLGILLANEYTITDACDHAAIVVPHYDRDLAEVKYQISRSDNPFAALGKHESVHPAVQHFFAVGCETGALDKTLRDASSYLLTELRLKEANVNQRAITEIQFYNALAMFMDVGFPLRLTPAPITYFSEYINSDVLEGIKCGIKDNAKLYPSLIAYPELFDLSNVQRIKQVEMKPKESTADATTNLIYTLKHLVSSLTAEKTNSPSYQTAQRLLGRPERR